MVYWLFASLYYRKFMNVEHVRGATFSYMLNIFTKSNRLKQLPGCTDRCSHQDTPHVILRRKKHQHSPRLSHACSRPRAAQSRRTPSGKSPRPSGRPSCIVLSKEPPCETWLRSTKSPGQRSGVSNW